MYIYVRMYRSRHTHTHTVAASSFIPAVNHSGRSTTVCLYVMSQHVSEAYQGLSALWHAMIWPGSEVEVAHHALLGHLALWRRLVLRNTRSF